MIWAALTVGTSDYAAIQVIKIVATLGSTRMASLEKLRPRCRIPIEFVGCSIMLDVKRDVKFPKCLTLCRKVANLVEIIHSL